MEPDGLEDIVDECARILDEGMAILADVEYDIQSSKEDIVETSMTRESLVDMVHEVADSERIRKAESSFLKRRLV